jgi:hypothetical protein
VAGAGAIAGIGLTSGTGFFVRETGGFLGMPSKMRSLQQNGKLKVTRSQPWVVSIARRLCQSRS